MDSLNQSQLILPDRRTPIPPFSDFDQRTPTNQLERETVLLLVDGLIKWLDEQHSI